MQNEALEMTVNGLGYELVEASRDARGVLRVTIDTHDGVGLDDCERVSGHLGYFLPVEGIDYDRLEVSSPGVDRPLTKPAHYERFVGRKARIQVLVPIDGQRNFTGAIAGADLESVSLAVDDGTQSFRYDDIKSARLCIELDAMGISAPRRGRRRQ